MLVAHERGQPAHSSELLAELIAPRRKMTMQGIQIESKEAIVKRLGRSPD